MGIALSLAREGAKVVVGDLDSEAASSTAAIIKSAGATAISVQVDVAQVWQVRRLFATTVDRFGDLHILVNNAGVLLARTIDEYSGDDWDVQMDVNLKGLFFCLQAAAQIMVPKGRGKIVNLSSTSAFVSSTSPHAGYDASKGGIRQLTISAAAELGPYGINVNAVAPGTIKTEMTKRHWESVDQDLMEAYLQRIPMGRLGTPADVVGPVLFLCSAESDYVTGHVLVVDGGWLTN